MEEKKECFICPNCGENSILEVETKKAKKILYTWNEQKNIYEVKEEYLTEIGDLYIECGNCFYKYSELEYREFTSLV